MAERLRIGFVDFWSGFDPRDNFLRNALERNVRTEVVERSPDLLFYSVYGTRNLWFRGPKVLVNGEAHSTDYGYPDFSIGFHEPTNESRLRLPIWAWHAAPELVIPSARRHPDEGSEFCAFLYSNPSCDYRNRFFAALDRRKRVTALGPVFGGRPADRGLAAREAVDWRSSKISALREFRFTISFENVQMPGYSTEKLTDAFLSGTIPIYWGDPFVAEDFNTKAFIDSSSFASYREIIEYVLWLDSDPTQRHPFRSEAPMSEEQYKRYFDGQLAEFLRACIRQSPNPTSLYWKRVAKGALTLPMQPSLRNPVAAMYRSLASRV